MAGVYVGALVSAALEKGKCSETESCPESPVLSFPRDKLGAGRRRRGVQPRTPLARGAREPTSKRSACGVRAVGLREASSLRRGGHRAAPGAPALAPAPRAGGDGTRLGGAGSRRGRAYLQVGPPVGHAAHDDVRPGHGPGGREAEAHVAGGAHLEAEGEPAAPGAPAQPVLALGVEKGAVREGPAQAPRRRCAGEQPPKQEQRPAAHPQAPPARRHLGRADWRSEEAAGGAAAARGRPGPAPSARRAPACGEPPPPRPAPAPLPAAGDPRPVGLPAQPPAARRPGLGPRGLGSVGKQEGASPLEEAEAEKRGWGRGERSEHASPGRTWALVGARDGALAGALAWE